MAAKQENNKWINSFIAILGVIVTYVGIKFFNQLGESFDLEAKIPRYEFAVQGIGILLGLLTFLIIFKSQKAMGHMREVYGELSKVVWADRDVVIRITIGLMIALSIISGIFVLVDFSFRKVLELIY